MEQYYKIAGLTVCMDSFGRTKKQAELYKIPPCENPDIQIKSFWEERKHERPFLSDDDGEYLATGSDFYKKLLEFEGLMLHSSAVVVDGKAYLFSADSGTGKSTHTTLWLNHFKDRAYILNDDKPALRLENGTWYAYGTPWSGKHDISVNNGVPVAGIAMVHRGEINKISRWNDNSIIPAIMRQVNHPKGMASRIKLLELLDKLIVDIPIWKLTCNMNPDAVKVSYEAMSGDELDIHTVKRSLK